MVIRTKYAIEYKNKYKTDAVIPFFIVIKAAVLQK